ncbi:MAG: sporulation transcriptional regulator SpoIIID [Oscillospiraceae bacterium]|nr:sporulation transcriptional regulator SpoIIID [Oscillospiraceae bacterium]
MKGNIEERACELAIYIIENRTTVREAAKRFGISKSTVHMDRGKWNGLPGRQAA